MIISIPRRSVILATIALTLACAREAPVSSDVLADVRRHVSNKDFAGGARVVEAYRDAHGVTAPMLDALSTLAFAALTAGELDAADVYARQTYDLAKRALESRPLDQEPQLPLALGRAIEVLARVRVARGARAETVAFLERELATYRQTSIENRIRKNINVLTMEGTVAPALDFSEHLGNAPRPLTALQGKVVLLFFWAHWCADCKAQGPILSNLLAKYGAQGLTIVAPTQRYGYVAAGVPAAPADETPYIEAVLRTHYPALAGVSIPLSEVNHRQYGVSSTPTLVLVDRRGIVRRYHPGRLREDELDPLIRGLIEEKVVPSVSIQDPPRGRSEAS